MAAEWVITWREIRTGEYDTCVSAVDGRAQCFGTLTEAVWPRDITEFDCGYAADTCRARTSEHRVLYWTNSPSEGVRGPFELAPPD